MIGQIPSLIRILLNPAITTVPRRVLRELRARGIRRFPDDVDRCVQGKAPPWRMLSFLNSWLGSELLSRHNGQWVLNSFCPPFPGPSFNRAFENLLSDRRFSPISAFCAVTNKCSYRCWHCSLSNRPGAVLEASRWESIVDQLIGIGTCIIGFTGGEPLTRSDLPDLIRRAASRGVSTILFTAGIGFDQRYADSLKDAGLWSLCVSLDDADPAKYDRMRGAEGAFAQAIRTVDISRAAGFYTMIGSVATRSFVEEKRYMAVYELATVHGVDEMRIVEPMPCGKLADEKVEFLLKPEHVKALREFHCSINKKGRLPKVCAFNQIESPQVFGCAGGIQHLYVDSAGEVCPCDFTPLSFGNLTREPLDIVWKRMTDAMGQPRRDCIVQKYHELFSEYAGRGYPITMPLSAEIASRLAREELPDYYKMVMRS